MGVWPSPSLLRFEFSSRFLLVLLVLIVVITGIGTPGLLDKLKPHSEYREGIQLDGIARLVHAQNYTSRSLDLNGNKIDDRMEDLNDPYDIFIEYTHPPTDEDLRFLSDLGVNVTNRYSIVNAVAATNVTLPIVYQNLTELPRVDFIEWQGPQVTTFLNVSAAGVKSRNSTTYLGQSAEENGVTGADVGICIIDTGVDDAIHESLQGKFVAGYNAITGVTGNPDDDNGHGTHVAGIALGTGGPNATFRGVAPGAKLFDVKTLSASGSGTGADVIESIEWCISNKDVYATPIRIISMSLGFSCANSDGTTLFDFAVNHAFSEGIVVAVAAGNCGPSPPHVGPLAAADGAIAVASIDDFNTVNRTDDAISEFSDRGPRFSDGDSDVTDELKPDIAAPGRGIISAKFNTVDQYVSLSGTSMATPHVAGMAALLLEEHPEWGPLVTKYALKIIAEERDATYDSTLSMKYDVEWGWGEIQWFRPQYVDACFPVSCGLPARAPRVPPSLNLCFLDPERCFDLALRISIPNATLLGGLPLQMIIRLSWSSAADLDLHLFDPTGGHIGFNYQTGVNETLQNSSYTGRTTRPEVIEILDLEPGNWTLGVLGKTVPSVTSFTTDIWIVSQGASIEFITVPGPVPVPALAPVYALFTVLTALVSLRISRVRKRIHSEPAN